jgi:hypothetical protein
LGEVLLALEALAFVKLSLSFFGEAAVLSADFGLPLEPWLCEAEKSEEPWPLRKSEKSL